VHHHPGAAPPEEVTILANEPDDAWHHEDVHRTLVLPTYANFFLTEYVNATHMLGVSVIPLHAYGTSQQGVVVPKYEWTVRGSRSVSGLWGY
jgi:hypothetical protein